SESRRAPSKSGSMPLMGDAGARPGLTWKTAPMRQRAQKTWNALANLRCITALAVAIAVLDGSATWQAAQADEITRLRAAVIATNIPGAPAISQVGTFLNVAAPPTQCAHPIPTFFPSFIQPGAILDPKGILVGSRSNFGAPSAAEVGQDGSFLSIDPSQQV